MSLPSSRADFFTALESVVNAQKEPNWFILKEISKRYIDTKDLYFSFHDGPRTREYPFQGHQGYLCIEDDAEKPFAAGLKKLIQSSAENIIALSNIYIVVCQISGDQEFTHRIKADFRRELGAESEKVYDCLIQSLNRKYFKHHYHWGKEPGSVQEWLDVFRSSQGFHNITDPLIYTKKLVQGEKSQHLPYKYILPMKPLLRATLMGWYNFQLEATSQEVLTVIKKSPAEAAFVAASMLDDIGPEKKAPEWLDESIVETLIKQYWVIIGKPLFEHVYGISFRNANDNELFKKLRELLNKVLLKLIDSSNADEQKWLEQFDLPHTFIAFFSWLHQDDRNISAVPELMRHKITQSFLTSIGGIADNFVNYLSADNHSDPFNSYNYFEERYQRFFGYMLLYLLDGPASTIRQLKQLCLRFKPMYYGGYEASLIASRFTEFLLLILLSADYLENINEETKKRLQEISAIVADLLLVPYVHLTERSSDIWEKDAFKHVGLHNQSKELINARLLRTANGKYQKEFKEFFKTFQACKVAEWPFERVSV